MGAGRAGAGSAARVPRWRAEVLPPRGEGRGRTRPAAGGGGARGQGERGEELRQKGKAVTKGKSQTVRSSQRLRHSTLGSAERGPARQK